MAFLISDFCAGRQLRARAAHHVAPARSDPGDGERSAGGGAARRRHDRARRSGDRRERSVRHGGARRRPRSRARRARRSRRAARCSSGCRWIRSRCGPTAPTSRRSPRSSRRARGGCGIERAAAALALSPAVAVLLARAAWAADAVRGRAGRGPRPSIPTRPPSRRASIGPRRTSAIRSGQRRRRREDAACP